MATAVPIPEINEEAFWSGVNFRIKSQGSAKIEVSSTGQLIPGRGYSVSETYLCAGMRSKLRIIPYDSESDFNKEWMGDVSDYIKTSCPDYSISSVSGSKFRLEFLVSKE